MFNSLIQPTAQDLVTFLGWLTILVGSFYYIWR